MIRTLTFVAVVFIHQAACPCTKHSDCVGQQMCYAGNCVPAMPAGGMCTADSQCETARGQACISGICMVPVATTAAPPTVLPFPFPPIPGITIPLPGTGTQFQFCLGNNHTSCPGQQMCYFFFCVPAIPVGKACPKGNECDATQACKFGECWRIAVNVGTAG